MSDAKTENPIEEVLNSVREVLGELFALLEAMETRNDAILLFLKDQDMATGEKLTPYLEQAGNASSVRWRAARRRMEYLLSPVDTKSKEADTEEDKKEQEQEKDKEKDKENDQERAKDSPRPPEKAPDENRAASEDAAKNENGHTREKPSSKTPSGQQGEVDQSQREDN
jgi:hypothetical protein